MKQIHQTLVITSSRANGKWAAYLLYMRTMWKLGLSTEHITMDVCIFPRRRELTIIFDDLHMRLDDEKA